jgi:hypothetical protein
VRTLGGAPIAGATVTLYRSDDPGGPFVPVPDGSAIMSPANQHNPDTTDATGHFGWDVLSGFYVVRAQKDGCTGPGGAPYVESAVMSIPPPVTDLDLRLDCGLPLDTTPPVIAPHDDVTAEATTPTGADVSYTAPTAVDDVDGPVPVSCAPAGGTFPLGSTEITCSAADAAGNSAQSTFHVIVADTSKPVITVPADISVNATGPGGATAAYPAATATDANDGSVAVSCSPASGSLFPIGDNAVTCNADDGHGNAADPRSFQVHVEGAGEQLGDLLQWAVQQGAGPGTSIPDKLRLAINTWAGRNAASTCLVLVGLDNEARAQTGKKLTADQAARIRGDVARIRQVLGC